MTTKATKVFIIRRIRLGPSAFNGKRKWESPGNGRAPGFREVAFSRFESIVNFCIDFWVGNANSRCKWSQPRVSQWVIRMSRSSESQSRDWLRMEECERSVSICQWDGSARVINANSAARVIRLAHSHQTQATSFNQNGLESDAFLLVSFSSLFLLFRILSMIMHLFILIRELCLGQFCFPDRVVHHVFLTRSFSSNSFFYFFPFFLFPFILFFVFGFWLLL